VIVAAPVETPVTTPLSEPTVAADELLLHAPPPTASLIVVVAPTHTVEEPVIAVGDTLTDTVVVVRQPVSNV
jgi:hypothetical protein